MSWIKELLQNTMLVFASVLIALLIAEIMLQILPTRRILVPPWEPQGYLRHDAELGVVIAAVPDRRFDLVEHLFALFGVYEVDKIFDPGIPISRLKPQQFVYAFRPP